MAKSRTTTALAPVTDALLQNPPSGEWLTWRRGFDDQGFSPLTVAREITLRIYLTIGFAALVGLAVLVATSTDAMVRRLGRRWQTLHRHVYLICLLGLIHYSMQSKLEQWEPVIADGIFVWLMAYRLLAWKFAVRGRLGLGWIAGLGVVATVLTGIGEAVYFCVAFAGRVTFERQAIVVLRRDSAGIVLLTSYPIGRVSR